MWACFYAVHFPSLIAKQPNLKLKTQPKQPLGSFPLPPLWILFISAHGTLIRIKERVISALLRELFNLTTEVLFYCWNEQGANQVRH
jgi:hypothetical protein